LTLALPVSTIEGVEVAESQSLSGGDVLPGFELPLADLFVKLGEKPD
jgi:hypothetical protein